MKFSHTNRRQIHPAYVPGCLAKRAARLPYKQALGYINYTVLLGGTMNWVTPHYDFLLEQYFQYKCYPSLP